MRKDDRLSQPEVPRHQVGASITNSRTLYVCVYMYIYTYTYIDVCIYIYIYVCKSVNMYIATYRLRPCNVCMRAGQACEDETDRKYNYIYIYIYIYIHMHITINIIYIDYTL